MNTDNPATELSEAELRELIPQLQRLTEKYKRAELIQKALFDISELASSTGELGSLFPAIHEIVGSFLDARNFFVAFYEPETDLIDFTYFIDEYDETILKQVPADQLKGGLTGYILRTGNHLMMNKENREQQLEETGVTFMGSTPVDLIAVPLKRGSQVIGAMVVQSYDEAVRYKPDDLEVLLFVSQHIVNCVDRVKSRELTERNIRERTKQLRKINDELQEEILERQKVESLQQALFEISELAATVDEDMPQFYANLHQILARLMSAPNSYIAILSEDGEMLEFPYFLMNSTIASALESWGWA